MKPSWFDLPLSLAEEPDPELTAYLTLGGLAISPKITAWWRALSPGQRRTLLERAVSSAEGTVR